MLDLIKQMTLHFINFRNEQAMKVLKFGTRENKKSLKQRIWLHFIISFENNLFAFHKVQWNQTNQILEQDYH